MNDGPSRPIARNPQQARELYEYKMAKRWPFLEARAYDTEYDSDYHTFGKTIRANGNKPDPKGIIQSDNYFFYHSKIRDAYIFVHCLRRFDRIFIRGLAFESISSAYSYAHRYGCKIHKRPLQLDITDFMTVYDADDIDMVIDKIDPVFGTSVAAHRYDSERNNLVHLRRGRNE